MLTFTDTYIINTHIENALNNINEDITNSQIDFQTVQTNSYNNENVQKLIASKKNINNKLNTLLEIDNYLFTSIPKLNSSIIKIKESILAMEIQNKELASELETSYQEKESTKVLINNYKEMYHRHFLRNWGIFLSILVSLVVLSNFTPLHI